MEEENVLPLKVPDNLKPVAPPPEPSTTPMVTLEQIMPTPPAPPPPPTPTPTPTIAMPAVPVAPTPAPDKGMKEKILTVVLVLIIVGAIGLVFKTLLFPTPDAPEPRPVYDDEEEVVSQPRTVSNAQYVYDNICKVRIPRGDLKMLDVVPVDPATLSDYFGAPFAELVGYAYVGKENKQTYKVVRVHCQKGIGADDNDTAFDWFKIEMEKKVTKDNSGQPTRADALVIDTIQRSRKWNVPVFLVRYVANSRPNTAATTNYFFHENSMTYLVEELENVSAPPVSSALQAELDLIKATSFDKLVFGKNN